MTRDPPAERGSFLAGVVLAAGLSRRFHGRRSKLLLDLGGEALIRRVVQTALGSRLRQVVVVLGHAAPEVRSELTGLDVVVVENRAFAEGQSTSVKAGLEGLDPYAQGAMFLPADQPLLSSRSIDRLIEAYKSSGRKIIRPRVGDRRGAPVLWDRALFPALLRLSGDRGARKLLSGYREEVFELELEDRWELVDVDTADDYRQLREIFEKRSSDSSR